MVFSLQSIGSDSRSAPKRLVILGSTGSIGQQALDVVRSHPDRLRVVGLAAGKNTPLLEAQAAEFRPLAVSSAATIPALSPLRSGGVKIVPIEELAALQEADLVLVSTVGAAGLLPTLSAIAAKKPVALANKEVLVIAGDLVAEYARRQGAPILPVDSEHNALWQCLQGESPLGVWSESSPIARLILTASGGAFRDRSLADLARVSPEEALHHPNWVMGEKVTIDSATLMNKGFEVIEAHHLFAMPYDRIDVTMHRESMVHSLVEFVDGSVKAQIGPPDMRLPIQYALTYPERLTSPVKRLDISALGALHFGPLDLSRYPCFRLAAEAARMGGVYPAILSGADEEAVGLFARGQIGFLDIPRLIEEALSAYRPGNESAVDGSNQIPLQYLGSLVLEQDFQRELCRNINANDWGAGFVRRRARSSSKPRSDSITGRGATDVEEESIRCH